MRKLKPVSVAFFISILAALLLVQTASGNSHNGEARGVFGTVLSITGNGPELDYGGSYIALDTASGPVNLTIAAHTVVRVPGFASASLQDLTAGDAVAVLASGDRALSILVRPGQPVATRHFTGVLIAVDPDENAVSLESNAGERISAPVLGDLRGFRQGQLVTAVLEQDLDTGELVISGLEGALDGLARITATLEMAQASDAEETFTALRERLISRSTSHLSDLHRAAQRATPPLQSQIRQEADAAFEAYATALARYDSGKPRVEVTGLITAVGRDDRRITVAPEGLEPVTVTITDGASLWRVPVGLSRAAWEIWLRGGHDTQAYVEQFGGVEAQFEQLELASRVTLWYELTSGTADRVIVLPAVALEADKAGVLLSLALAGEVTGRIIVVNSYSSPPSITIRDDLRETSVTLKILPGSRFQKGDAPSALFSLLGSSVATSFDPTSLAVIVLDILPPEPPPDDDRAYASGVVHSFIPKVAPGNLSILTSDAGLRAFNHTEDTVIVRGGRRVTISQIRIGDSVRPNTQYETANNNLVMLSVEPPLEAPVQGAIRGIAAVTDAAAVLTLSDNRLKLVTLLVTARTQLTGPDATMNVDGLEVGQWIVSGAYDPISEEASHLVVGPPLSTSR